MRLRAIVLVLATAFALGAAARAEGPTLTISLGDVPRPYSAAELLGRSDAATITIPADVSYGRPMTFRAVPLLALIPSSANPALDTIEARASDGFVSQLPRALIGKGASGGAVAWIAVEDAASPWPNLPDKQQSAGPFYLVWEHPERSGVGSEQWPYQTVALTGVESPAHRWPQMAVDASLPADAPARHGQEVFAVQCLPCHRMKGAGEGELGPDLGQPMSPAQYFTPEALRKLIRDPKSVRTWPQQMMPAFGKDKLSDADLDAVVAYLGAMAPGH
jgi:mono/diheme cytochrome c family protein